MKRIVPLALIALLGCATTYQLTNQYQTLGHNVNEYSDGYDSYFEIFDQSGNLIGQANLLGFIQWKRARLLELIGDEQTTVADRERYKIEYEDIARKLDIYNSYMLNNRTKNLAPTVNRRNLNLCSSTNRNC